MSFLEKLSQHRLIPLFYHNDIEVCKRVIDAVINSNLPILEFTNRGSKAIQNFEYLINYVGTKSDFLLGMGSVKNDEEALKIASNSKYGLHASVFTQDYFQGLFLGLNLFQRC